MSRTVYVKTALLGGGNDALDGIDGAILQDSDLAYVYVNGAKYEYYLAANSGLAASPPSVISPSTNAGNKRWLLQSPQNLPSTEISADYTISSRDYSLLVNASSGNVTLTLPAASDVAGRTYLIKKVDTSSNQVIIQAANSDQLEGAVNKILSKRGAGLTVQSDGMEWKIIGVIPAINIVPSENLQWSNDIERSTTSFDWVKKKEIKLNQDIAALRVKFEIQTYYTYGSVYGQVRVNDNNVGITRSTSTTRVVVSQDFYNFHNGDLLQVYICVDNDTVPGMVRNFRLYWSEVVEAFGDCVLASGLESPKSWDVNPTNQDP